MKKTLFEIKNLSFAYDSQLVLEKIDFIFQKGDFWAIIGPNGGGKSTLIKLILGILKITEGEIKFCKNFDTKHIGYVPQNTNENIHFPIQTQDVIKMGFLKPSIWGFRTNKAQERQIQEMMEKLDILHLYHKPLSKLSGGQRQKVLIARALINNPTLLVLDEPTSNVDSTSQKSIYKLLESLNANGQSILVISHDISVLLGYAKKVLYVNKNAIPHTIPKLNLEFDSHICEVDILTHFANLLATDIQDSKDSRIILESQDLHHQIDVRTPPKTRQ